jgi:hypothetical protein
LLTHLMQRKGLGTGCKSNPLTLHARLPAGLRWCNSCGPSMFVHTSQRTHGTDGTAVIVVGRVAGSCPRVTRDKNKFPRIPSAARSRSAIPIGMGAQNSRHLERQKRAPGAHLANTNGRSTAAIGVTSVTREGSELSEETFPLISWKD